MRLTVGLPSFGDPPGGDWRTVLDLAREADDAGVDRVVVSDHVVMGRNTDKYVWGRFPLPPEGAWMEPLTMLTAFAAVTTRVRLGTNILIAPLRPAALLAKTVATLDQLSHGRVDLGVGTGWQREEYEAEGLDFDRRGRLLSDTIAACRALWTDTPASIDAPTVAFDDIFCEPKPVQARLPVWFSGVLHERNLARVVELGDGWIPIMGATVDDVRDGVVRLRAAFEKAGRDPSELRVSGTPAFVKGDLDATLANVGPLAEAGVTDVSLNLRLLGDAGSLADAVAAFRRATA